MKIAAIDVGRRNFAVRAERITKNGCEPLIYDLVDFEQKVINRQFLGKITDYLDEYDWSIFDVICIEGQVAYVKSYGASAITNMKIQQFLESYFFIKYREVEVCIIPPNSKYPKCLKGLSDSVRKRGAITIAKNIFSDRQDTKSLKVLEKAKRKADDLSDTLLLILAYAKKVSDLFPRIMENPENYYE